MSPHYFKSNLSVFVAATLHSVFLLLPLKSLIQQLLVISTVKKFCIHKITATNLLITILNPFETHRIFEVIAWLLYKPNRLICDCLLVEATDWFNQRFFYFSLWYPFQHIRIDCLNLACQLLTTTICVVMTLLTLVMESDNSLFHSFSCHLKFKHTFIRCS